KNKETADHSFYFCTAVGLVAGECTSAQFEPRWLHNPDVARLMAVSTLKAKPEMTALFKKGARPAAVEVKTKRGTFTREVLYPKGDPKNPMTWDDVSKKFMDQAQPILGASRAHEVIERTVAIEKELNIRTFAEILGGV
ncbi:MAG: hypothetical protein WCK07_20135, partial [Betaproteobacteria bacterium]